MNQGSVWGLALRQLVRDWRAGELRLLLVAVSLAVAALSAVGFFADRLQVGLARDARSLIGGDAVVASDQPAPAALQALADKAALKTSTTVTFPSMARASEAQGGATRLAAVKAVSDVYSPLTGEVVEVNEALQDEPQRVNEDCYGEGWLIRVRMTAPGELGELMDADAYKKFLDEA